MTFATKGFAQPFAAIGREIFIKNFDKGAAMSQADLQALVEAVQMTSSIVAIGAFVAGTSEAVSMIIDGKDVAAVAGYTVTDVAF